ncbi:aminoacyl-histidine dipeptidase [candidate division KSB1 bacterium]|nr:aminoacyl-histidine dipeptidase [candidate division KSB1 bacterium]
MNITHAKTKEVLKWFEEITKIPRCSKHEEKIAAWLIDWAKQNNFSYKMDDIKNLVIQVPGSKGYENAGPVIIQGHLDMVCEKTPDSTHDFSKDPIKLVYDGEWLTADKTTLGADNGIAIAMAMAMSLDKDLAHPPLELLFTVDEETGLTGATKLSPDLLKGRILINVDSEDEGVFTVGCAGGMNTYTTIPVKTESIPAGYKACNLVAGGMKGGHSGIDIAMGKANAIKILTRVLFKLVKEVDVRVADIKGGSAHNAIPRDASAVVFLAADAVKKATDIVLESSKICNSEFQKTDPQLAITLEETTASVNQVLTAASTKNLINYLYAVPHGVAAMSPDIEGLVETSNNLANISMKDGSIHVLTSQRSSVVTRLQAHTNRIEATAELAGGSARSGDGYPPWQPNMKSPLLAKSTALYEKMFNKKPIVEVIHAGLECGIIGDKYPGMDMISIGPDLRNPHSPDEKVHIGAVGMVYDFIEALLKELK